MPHKPYGPGKLLFESIRKENFKLIRNYEKNNSFVLFDLDEDITESYSNNLAKDEAYHGLIQEMYSKLKKIGPCYDKKGKFELVNLKGQVRKRNCAWFRKEPKKTARRCKNSKEGRQHCRLTCMSHIKECEILI